MFTNIDPTESAFVSLDTVLSGIIAVIISPHQVCFFERKLLRKVPKINVTLCSPSRLASAQIKGIIPASTPNKAATTNKYKSDAPIASQNKTFDDCILTQTIGDCKKGGNQSV
jgi:hypothetical protein